MKRVLLLVSIGLVLLVGGVYAWATVDASAPDDSSFLAPSRPSVRSEDNGYAVLEALGEEVGKLDLAERGRVKQSIPATYDERTRAVADDILHLELVQRLTERVEQVLSAPAFQPTDPPFDDSRQRVARGSLDVVNLLRLRIQQALFSGAASDAWRTAQSSLRLCQLFHRQTDTFHELSVAQACQTVLFKAMLAGIDAGRWEPRQLRELAALADAPSSSEPKRFIRALQTEYRLFVVGADQQSADSSPFWRRVSYHRDRSKRAWLGAMALPFAAIHKADLPGAYQALRNAEVSTRQETTLVRNALGSQLLAVSVARLATPIARAVDGLAEVRLVKLRAALASYRAERGRWPESLDLLVGPYITALPNDPWSARGFSYSASKRALYSVGEDRKDDGGKFAESLSRATDSTDYGVRLPD
jgi:hypothetical protein